MEATELRIGNRLEQGVVNHIGYTEGYFRCGILKNEFCSSMNFYKYDELTPILLTEDILLKCGFRNVNIMPDDFFDNEKTDIEYHSQTFDLISVYLESFINIMIIKDLIIAINEKDGLYYFVEETLGVDENSYLHAISAPMQYLHTLQNYFPAFSGQELEINL